jgi:hypothetical protein
MPNAKRFHLLAGEHQTGMKGIETQERMTKSGPTFGVGGIDVDLMLDQHFDNGKVVVQHSYKTWDDSGSVYSFGQGLQGQRSDYPNAAGSLHPHPEHTVSWLPAVAPPVQHQKR